MSGVTQFDWPDDDRFVELFREGGWARVSEVVGCKERRAREYAVARKLDLKPKVARKEPPPVGEPVSELELIRHERDDALRQLSRARGEEVATERIIRTLESGVSAAKPTYIPSSRKTSGNQDAHTLVLMFSDAHAGEVVSPIETNGLNEYNWQVMLERFRRLADAVRSHRDHYGVAARHLKIYSLGDGLSGNIHEELKETNEFPFAECIVRFGEDVGSWISTEFASEFETIEYDAVVGNHPRYSKKQRAKVAYDNGDWIASETTRLYLRNHEKISVRAHRARQAIVETCGEKHALIHGDGVRTTMAGIPWGGIVRHTDKLRKLFDLADIPVKRVFGGHWHNSQIAEEWSIFINGSIKGIDEYGIGEYGDGKPAGQVLVAMHPKWGVTGAHKIDLQ